MVWALVAYGIIAIALLLSPIGPGEIVDAATRWIRTGWGWTQFRQGWIEAPANVLLFVPLGLLLTLLFRRPWVGVVLAVTLSVAVEVVQTVLPGRIASPRDVLANLIGAVIGAVIGVIILRRRSRPRRATTHAG